MGFGGIRWSRQWNRSPCCARNPQQNQCPGQVRFMQPVHTPTVAQQQRGLHLKKRHESPLPTNHPESRLMQQPQLLRPGFRNALSSAVVRVEGDVGKH